jgi:hypothetical protein
MQLLLGCGHEKEKRFGFSKEWSDLVTLDINPETKPDVQWDMNNVPLPFGDSSADEIHAYDVLEHVGKQGDYQFFFRQFEDFWRILKPDGFFFASVPWFKSLWLWGDPGHTRMINNGTLTFLEQKSYKDVGTKRTDYRNIYKGDFKIIASRANQEEIYEFAMQAIK